MFIRVLCVLTSLTPNIFVCTAWGGGGTSALQKYHKNISLTSLRLPGWDKRKRQALRHKTDACFFFTRVLKPERRVAPDGFPQVSVRAEAKNLREPHDQSRHLKSKKKAKPMGFVLYFFQFSRVDKGAATRVAEATFWAPFTAVVVADKSVFRHS